MDTYLYLSLIPESLVVSMLPPEEFGTYLAVGTKKRSRGPAMFFALPGDLEVEGFNLRAARDRCVPHPDGSPKHSVYAGIDRVLERVPLDAIGPLHLVTRDGRVLALEQDDVPEAFKGQFYLYQELSPVHPLIVSTLSPDWFGKFITDPGQPVSVPTICFADLGLGDLGEDPRSGRGSDLPYEHLDHLRDCLLQLSRSGAKHTKTVDRTHPQEFPYRMIRHGFYVAERDRLLYYPFPSREELDRDHHEWWRSATVVAPA